MAEIKKINGNALCDETARVKADEAKTTADEAKSLAETAGDGATEAKTTAEMAQRTADEAKTTADEAKTAADEAKTATDSFESTVQGLSTEVSGLGEVVEEAQTTANKAFGNVHGTAKIARYDADNKRLKFRKYSTDGGYAWENLPLGSMGSYSIIEAKYTPDGESARYVPFVVTYNTGGRKIEARLALEDKVLVLSGAYASTLPSECEVELAMTEVPLNVQADWNESDTESPAYIQNRIGGYKLSDAERLVEYDETTAEYIDVDATGSGTVLRYRKASDTLVRKEDWVGGKTVIVMDTDSGEQEATLNIGTGESNAIDIIEKEYAAGKIWLTSMGKMCCGIIAPQETDLSASADGVSVVASGGGPNGVVPKGVWILDMPYAMNLLFGGETTGYHKAVYCGGVVKIPEEYLDTTTAEEAKATAEEMNANFSPTKSLIIGGKTNDSTIAFRNGIRILGNADEASEGDATGHNYAIRANATSYGDIEMAFTHTVINKEYTWDGVKFYIFKDGETKRANITNIDKIDVNAVVSGGSTLTVSDKQLLLDGEPVAPTYTAGDGIAIEDGVITADTDVLAKKEDIPERTIEEWTFTLDSGETVTKKVVLSND